LQEFHGMSFNEGMIANPVFSPTAIISFTYAI